MVIFEPDRVRYQLMQTLVCSKVSTLSELGLIVNGLKSLSYALEEKDEIWISLLLEEWWVLEEIYSVKLAYKRIKFSVKELEKIIASKEIILTLIKLKLNAE